MLSASIRHGNVNPLWNSLVAAEQIHNLVCSQILMENGVIQGKHHFVGSAVPVERRVQQCTVSKLKSQIVSDHHRRKTSCVERGRIKSKSEIHRMASLLNNQAQETKARNAVATARLPIRTL
jgi:hypothetical protein